MRSRTLIWVFFAGFSLVTNGAHPQPTSAKAPVPAQTAEASSGSGSPSSPIGTPHSVPGTDNLLKIIEDMTSGQWLMISSFGAGNANSGNNSGGFIAHDQFARTLANFDGTPGCVPATGSGCYTFTNNPNVAHQVGTTRPSFSRPVCNATGYGNEYNATPSSIVCYQYQGGHGIDSDTSFDSSVYKFDVKAAADDIVARGGTNCQSDASTACHWTVLTPSARLIPNVLAPPADVHSGSGIGAACPGITGNLSASTPTRITNLSNTSCYAPGWFVGDQSARGYIEDYTYVVSTVGTTVNVDCPDHDCIRSNQTRYTFFIDNNYWAIDNKNGDPMPGSVHAYFGDVLTHGGKTLTLGGNYLKLHAGLLDGHPTYRYDIDTATGASSQNTRQLWGGFSCRTSGRWPPGNQQSSAALASDGHYYGFCANDNNYALNRIDYASAASLYTAAYGDCSVNAENIVIPDPVNGGPNQAVFSDVCDTASAPGGQFKLATKIATCTVVPGNTYNEPNPVCPIYAPQFATNPTTVFEQNSPADRCAAFDGTNVIISEGDGRIYVVSGLNTVGRSPKVTISLQDPRPTGNVPNSNNLHQQNCRIYDLGTTYAHAKLLITNNDIYLEKP